MSRPPLRSCPRTLAAALATALAGCARVEASAPQWPLPGWPAQGVVELARGFEPRPLAELAAHLEAAVRPARGGRFETLQPEGGGPAELWFELPLPRALWKPGSLPGEWRAPLAAGGALSLAETPTIELVDGAEAWAQSKTRVLAARLRAQGFRLDRGELVLGLPSGAEPSGELHLRARLSRGAAAGGRWRSQLGDVSCDGVLLFPGFAETFSCEVPPASRLAFTCAFPSAGTSGAGVLRVRLDGRTLLESAHPEPLVPRPIAHEVVLGVRGPRRLTFELEGAGPVLIGIPRLVPPALGSPGARPWDEARPDLVLVLCDTFRADNLAEYGGDPGLAPNLNRLVRRSLRFLDARATAAWTLPSIGSILSGVFPGQHGGTDLDRGVVNEVETLAEVLGEHGYRTAAITDSGLFSHVYRQDQGFQWFEEVPAPRWKLATTLALARERMAADDGRPLFLVVHTYRVHGPMRVGPEEDARPWHRALLGRAKGKFKALARAVEDPSYEGFELEEWLARVEMDFAESGLALRFYQDAVSDLDVKLGAWFEELDGAGFFARGVLALTADHGVAYGEHDQVGHGGVLYDVKLRVPLVFAGRGIAPRAERGLVSLIDIAPTLSALAGSAPPESWLGRSLLAANAPRPAFAFDLKNGHRQVALFAEGKKLLAPDVAALEAGRPSHAYDLAADPDEERNVAGNLTWPGELGRALAPAIEVLLVPAAEARSIELSLEAKRQLEAIGYGE